MKKFSIVDPNSLTRRLMLGSMAALFAMPMVTGNAKAASLDEIKKRGLIVATEDDFRPFEFVKDGKPTGFDNELIEDLRKYAPFEVKQEILPWTGILAGVSTGKYDVAITAAIITKERKKSLDFTSPIADATHYYVKRKDDTSITSIKDLNGKTVGVQAGSALLGRLPELGTMLEKDWRQARQDRRIHVLSGGLSGSGARPGRLRGQHHHQPEDAGGGKARVFEVGQAVSGPVLPGLGGRQGQHGTARLPERVHRQGKGQRPVRRTAEEVVRRGLPESAGRRSSRNSDDRSAQTGLS